LIETPAEIIAHHASMEAAEAFVAYRKRMGKAYALTERAAVRVAKSLQIIRDQGGCPDDALDMAQEHAWRTIKPEWYWNAKRQEGRSLRLVNDGNTDDPRNTGTDASARRIAFAARAGRTPTDDCF